MFHCKREEGVLRKGKRERGQCQQEGLRRRVVAHGSLHALLAVFDNVAQDGVASRPAEQLRGNFTLLRTEERRGA